MSFTCLYYFAYEREGFQHAFIEIKRTDVSEQAPKENRFAWFCIVSNQPQGGLARRYMCDRLRFLARGTTTDKESFRILHDGARTLLLCFNDTIMRLIAFNARLFARRDPQTLPERLRTVICDHLEEEDVAAGTT